MEIQELAESITDVTDPSSLDNVLIYYEKLENEIEEYMQLLVNTLEYRDLTWEQPWYQQGMLPLTRKHQPYYERNKIDTEKFRTDKFSKEELDLISKNWRKFVKKYKVPDNLRFFAGWRNKQVPKIKTPEERVRQFVIAYLARGLQRTIEQVFMHIRNFCQDQREAKYNEHEDKIINICLMHAPTKAPILLSIILGRHPRGLYKRRNVVKTGGKPKKRLKWNLEQATKLLRLLMRHADMPIDELKYKMFDKSLWIKMEQEMDREYIYLQYFWYYYLHVQIFVKHDVRLYKLRKRLFKFLRNSPYRVWSDIRWNDVVQHFEDGFTAKFLYRIISTVVRPNPKYLKIPLQDLVDYGLRTIKTYKGRNKRLRTLTLNKEGYLEDIQYS